MFRTATEPKVIYPEKGTSPEHEVQVCHHVSEGAREDTSRVVQDRSRDEREYMDDMRHAEDIERLEAREDGHREFIIESTG